jgi:DNA repair protein RadC
LFAHLSADARSERLQVAHLDTHNVLLGLQLRFGSTASAVELPLRAIITEALRMHSAALIVAHNHPSGDPQPSRADIEMTRELVQAARPIGVTVQDHLIFAGDRLVSFRELGLL